MKEQQQQQALVSIRQQIETQIIAKAMENQTYRQQLLTNPTAIIGKEFGVEIPNNVKVTILEENTNNLYFVLPNTPNEIPEEGLSEEQLEAVAGGGPWGSLVGGVVGAGATLLSGGSASEAIGNGLSGAALGLAAPTP
jgi:hypothetical protein